MATAEQRRRLLAVPCTWCGAGPQTECAVPSRRGRRGEGRITTLDGGCHNARWQRALGMDAPVLTEVVQRRVAADKERRGVIVLAARGGERPW